MADLLTLDELESALDELARLDSASAALGAKDEEAGRVARVLEYGSIAGEKPWPQPGPRTTLAVDPETGAEVVVSAQAPQGFLRLQAPVITNLLRDALARPADWLDATAAQEHLAAAVSEAAKASLAEIRDTAPRDSGQLADSLVVTVSE